jgi:hypothetical protein
MIPGRNEAGWSAPAGFLFAVEAVPWYIFKGISFQKGLLLGHARREDKAFE